jgi:hypothetical protein
MRRFHASLFARMPLSELTVLPFAEAGLNVYGNVVLASTRLIIQQPKVVAGFVRATNRAVQDTPADPVMAMGHVKQREPMINEQVELERWRITAGYVTAPDTHRGDRPRTAGRNLPAACGRLEGLTPAAPTLRALRLRGLRPCFPWAGTAI